jgi:hypothetical protein
MSNQVKFISNSDWGYSKTGCWGVYYLTRLFSCQVKQRRWSMNEWTNEWNGAIIQWKQCSEKKKTFSSSTLCTTNPTRNGRELNPGLRGMRPTTNRRLSHGRPHWDRLERRGRCKRMYSEVVESSWNVMAHGDAREGKWRGNWRKEWTDSTLHTTSEHGVSNITTFDAHTSAASSRLNWRPRRFKWTRPFRRKIKSGFCANATTFQTQSTAFVRSTQDGMCKDVALNILLTFIGLSPITP